jgi:hypothetical protein
MTTNVDDPAHWRSRAEQARALAKHVPDAASRQLMLNMARDYEHLAKRAEEWLERRPGP